MVPYITSRIRLVALLVCLCSPAQLIAHPRPRCTGAIPAAGCSKVCPAANSYLPTGQTLDDAHIVIDANTGKIIDGATRFAEGTKVQVVFVNKNPFKYSYRFQIVSEPLENAIALSFFRLISGFGAELDKAGKAASLDPKAPANCTGEDATKADALIAKAKRLKARSEEIRTALNDKTKSLGEFKKEYEKFLQDSETVDQSNCAALCANAETLLPKLRSFGLDDLPSVKDFAEQIAALDKEKDAFAATDPANGQSCTASTKGVIADVIVALQKDRGEYEKKVEELQKAVEASKVSVKNLAEIIERALSSEKSYVEVRYPQTVGAPTGVRITIFRKNLRVDGAAEETVATIELQVGESVLAISAGIGFSSIGDRRVVPRSSMVPDPNSTMAMPLPDILGNRFGFESQSDFKPSGVIMLNANLWNLGKQKSATHGPVTGLVLSNRNGGTEAEYILGWGVAFRRNTVFFNAGFHAARQESPAGGFKIGDVVPSTLTGDLPTQKNFKKGFMFAITYKIR